MIQTQTAMAGVTRGIMGRNPVFALEMIQTPTALTLLKLTVVGRNPVFALEMIQTEYNPGDTIALSAGSQSSIRPGDDSDWDSSRSWTKSLDQQSQSSIRPGDDSDTPP